VDPLIKTAGQSESLPRNKFKTIEKVRAFEEREMRKMNEDTKEGAESHKKPPRYVKSFLAGMANRGIKKSFGKDEDRSL